MGEESEGSTRRVAQSPGMQDALSALFLKMVSEHPASCCCGCTGLLGLSSGTTRLRTGTHPVAEGTRPAQDGAQMCFRVGYYSHRCGIAGAYQGRADIMVLSGRDQA